MINVAILEDNDSDAKNLENFLKRYSNDISEEITITRYREAVNFVSNYTHSYDVIFLDVEMPNMNGMEAANHIRKFDRQVVLIFVTNMAQFAIKGYEVDALYYVVKPIIYQDFVFKFNKAVDIVTSNREVEYSICQAGGLRRIATQDIIYVEISGHKLKYHLKEESIVGSGSLNEVESKLATKKFMRCNSCYLVNPKHIICVEGFELKMRNGDILQISHPRKKKFMTDLAIWLGKGNFV